MENDAGSTVSTSTTVRVLASFFLAQEDCKNAPIHKEKFNVPVCSAKHKDLFAFVKHLKAFTGINEIAKSKGLGENAEVTIARVHTRSTSGIEVFSIRTQDAWNHEHMYQRELPMGDRVNHPQDSEYDSDSSDEEAEEEQDEDTPIETSEGVEIDYTPVNFLSKTVYTRSGRAVTLSYRALSSY